MDERHLSIVPPLSPESGKNSSDIGVEQSPAAAPDLRVIQGGRSAAGVLRLTADRNYQEQVHQSMYRHPAGKARPPMDQDPK